MPRIFYTGEILLLSLSGYELYLKSYTSGYHNMNVIDHVIANKNFPRSIFYSLDRIKRYFDQVIVGYTDRRLQWTAKTIRPHLHSQVKFADLSRSGQ